MVQIQRYIFIQSMVGDNRNEIIHSLLLSWMRSVGLPVADSISEYSSETVIQFHNLLDVERRWQRWPCTWREPLGLDQGIYPKHGNVWKEKNCREEIEDLDAKNIKTHMEICRQCMYCNQHSIVYDHFAVATLLQFLSLSAPRHVYRILG